MESSKNAEYKKCERMNFFEKMALIEPRIDSKTKRNKVANKNFTKPPEESKMYSSARKVKQKFLIERVASLSPNSSPRSQSRSPSPAVSSHVSDQSTESNATLRVAEFRNPNLSVIQGSAKLEHINVDEFNKSSLSSHQFSSVTDTVKNISNEDELITSETIIDDEFNTPMSSAPVSVKSSNKLSTHTTSGNRGSLTHIKTSEMTQMKENDRSSTKRFNTAHPISASQEDNVELRKSPFVYLDIMQKEMIDKHMSSPSSSLKTNEKKQQVPSRAKLKDIAKCSPRSSPRSSPKLVKKPFRRSSLKSVSDSQVENALPTKNAKTPTNCSAVSPIKNETTSGPSDDLVITSKEPTNTLLAKFTQPDDTSSTHSSVDQEIVQIIPRFAVETDHKNEHDLCGRVNKTNNGEDTQSVDSLEMSSSASQLSLEPTLGCRSVPDIPEELATIMINEHMPSPSSGKTNVEKHSVSSRAMLKEMDDSDIKNQRTLTAKNRKQIKSKLKTSGAVDLTNDELNDEDDTNLRVPSVSNASETKLPNDPTEQASSKLTRKKSIEPVVNAVVSAKVEKKKQLTLQDKSSGKSDATDASTEQDSVVEVSIQKLSTRIEGSEKNSSPKRRRTVLHQKRGPRPRSKSPKGKESNTGVLKDNEKKGNVNDTEKLLGTVTRSGRKVKMSAVALEALEAATMGSDDDDDIGSGADKDKSVAKQNAQEKFKERCQSSEKCCSVSQQKTVVSPKSKTFLNSSMDPEDSSKLLIPEESPTRSALRGISTVTTEMVPTSRTSPCSSARNTRSSTVNTTETGNSASSGISGKQANVQLKEADSKSSTSSQDKDSHFSSVSRAQTRRSTSKAESVFIGNDLSTDNTCRQIQFDKESVPTPKKARKEKQSPKELKKHRSPRERKSSSKRSPNSKSPDAGECRVTRGRSKALATLITQVQDRLKTTAPVPENLQLETNTGDHSESFLSGGSSSEESGTSDDQIEDDDDDAASLSSRISDDDVRTPSPYKHSNVHRTDAGKCSEPSDANVPSIQQGHNVGNSTESSDKDDCSAKVPFDSYKENQFASGNQKQSTWSNSEVEMKELCDHSVEINKNTFEMEEFPGNSRMVLSDQTPSETGGNQLSVFEDVTDDDDTSSAFVSDKLERYLVKDRDINQTLKNDPFVYKPLSPPTKFTGVQIARNSPQKQFNSNPDVDDMDGVKVFSYASAKELCMHVDREKAIISEWNCDSENEESVHYHRTDVLSPEKTDDLSQIKGWRNKPFPVGSKNVENCGPKLRYFAARGLIRKLKPEEITELGLRLKARRRRSPVLLHQKSEKTEDVETKTSINIYGRRRDGRFATKRSVRPKKPKMGRPRKNEAGWREGWWNPVRGNTVRPEVLTPGMAVVAASALLPSYSEGVPDLELSACTKPGCRYGCVCHLCEPLADTQMSATRPLPDLQVNITKEDKCGKEYCRLGCICDSISPVCGGQKPVWKKNKNQHCGRPECMFECECGPKTRAMVLKKSPASLLTTNNIIKDDEEDSEISMKQDFNVCEEMKRGVHAETSEQDHAISNDVKKVANEVRHRGRKRKLKTARKDDENRPKRKYGLKCSAEERRRDMEEKLATARKSSRLTGHQSLAKIEKLNSLIYYDTAAWLKKNAKKGRGNKDTEDDADKTISVEDEVIKSEADELQPNITLLKEGKHQINKKTKEKMKTFRPSTPADDERKEKRRKKLEGLKNIDTPSLEPGLEGSQHSEILRHLTKDPKMYERPDVEKPSEELLCGSKDNIAPVNSCARTTIYLPVRRKTSCSCDEVSCVHKLTEAIAKKMLDGQKGSNGRRRHSYEGNQRPSKSTPTSKTNKSLLRRNSASAMVVSVPDKKAHALNKPLSVDIFPRFRTQMVVLQRTAPSIARPPLNATPENKRPHLLEISSNCNWEPIRSQLLGRMSAVCSVMGDFPPKMAFILEQYFVEVLPKPDKTTPIPPNLQPVLQTQEMFAIPLKITPVGYIGLSESSPPSIVNDDPLSQTHVKKLEQIHKAPTLAGMLAMATPSYATPLINPTLGMSGFKSISLTMAGGKIIRSTSSTEPISREFMPDPELASSKNSGIEPVEVIPIDDDSSSDTIPTGRQSKSEIEDENAMQTNFTSEGRSAFTRSDDADSEAVIVTIDEDMFEAGSTWVKEVTHDAECSSQEGDTVTITIDESVPDAHVEGGDDGKMISISPSAASDDSVQITRVSPAFAIASDSDDDLLSHNTDKQSSDKDVPREAHDENETYVKDIQPSETIYLHTQNVIKSDTNSLSKQTESSVDRHEMSVDHHRSKTENMTTDEDGSQDSVSISLPDLRPSSSCSERSLRSEHETHSAEPEAFDQSLLPDLVYDSNSQKRKSVSPTTLQPSEEQVSNQQKSVSKHQQNTKESKTQNPISSTHDSETQSGSQMSTIEKEITPKTLAAARNDEASLSKQTISNTVPLRLENGCLKFVSISPKGDVIKEQRGNNSKCDSNMQNTIRPIMVPNQQKIISVPGLTLIPVTAVHETMVNGKATKSYVKDKVAVPVSVFCAKIDPAKPVSTPASGIRRHSTGASTPAKSSATTARSSSTESTIAQTMSHFIPVNSKMANESAQLGQQKIPVQIYRNDNLSGGNVTSPLTIPSTVTGIDASKAFIPLDQLPSVAFGGLKNLEGSGQSAFQRVQLQSGKFKGKEDFTSKGFKKSAKVDAGLAQAKGYGRNVETPPDVIHILDDNEEALDTQSGNISKEGSRGLDKTSHLLNIAGDQYNVLATYDDDDGQSGRTSAVTSSGGWDDEASDSDISVGNDDPQFMKSLAEGEAMDDDILKTLKKSTNKQKQIIQEKKTASGSAESKEFFCREELKEGEGRRCNKEHKRREKLRRSNIRSSFNDLNALVDKIENNSVVQFDSRCVTKITILTKAIRCVHRLKMDDEMLTAEKCRLQEENRRVSETCASFKLELFHENLEKDGKTEVDRDTPVGSRSEDSEPGKKEAKSDTESGELMTGNKEEEGKTKVSPDTTDNVLENLDSPPWQRNSGAPEKKPKIVRAKTFFPPVRVIKKTAEPTDGTRSAPGERRNIRGIAMKKKFPSSVQQNIKEPT